MKPWFMNSNIKNFLLCPVPEEQRPLHEYIKLKEQDFTNSVISGKKRPLFFLIFSSFLIQLFFKFDFIDSEYLLRDLVGNLLFLCVSLFLYLALRYTSWKQVESRLNTPRLYYEEASWYDGKIWEKPLSILKNDKLISTQKVRPILQGIIRVLLRLFVVMTLLLILMMLV
jgi:hypothetical protein